MTSESSSTNRIRQHRVALGMTQAELAVLAGISRTAVTAIEGNHMVPSVAAALSLSKALGTSVELLFGLPRSPLEAETWASQPKGKASPYWQAEVNGRTVMYPADASPMLSLLPDQHVGGSRRPTSTPPNESLVIACCDPAAGMLASLFTATTGMRLIVLSRSSRQSVEMLREGFVHLAGLHLSTQEEPERNSQYIHQTLGDGFQTIRLARWQEGIVVDPTSRFRSVRAVLKANLNWIGRENGSGARQCLDQLLGNRAGPRHVAHDHRGVVEAVRSGWAQAGVCVQLASAEAGLGFLPVQQEAFDVCFSTALAEDRRIKAFHNVVRSEAYRRLLGDLPGYDMRETGNVWKAN